jgi:hypothetical protein
MWFFALATGLPIIMYGAVCWGLIHNLHKRRKLGISPRCSQTDLKEYELI